MDTEKKVVLVFYIKSQKAILHASEEQEDGYLQYRIYNKLRYGTFMQGYAGNIMIIKLSDESIIKTNDLWSMQNNWTKTIPDSVLEGTFITNWTEYEKYKNASQGVISYIY
jgi:hypothetical protein